MLLSYAGFKVWSAGESNAGLEAFEAARASQEQVADVTVALTESTAVVENTAIALPGDRGESPDMSLWSDARKAEYAEATTAEGEAPRAVLNIDHLDIRVPVYNGASDLNLNRGVARIIGTGQVGAEGNLGIAGHRDSFFRPLKDIEIGDEFTLETLQGTQAFRVSSIEIVDPSELRVLAPTDTPTVTLVTCYPFYYVGNAPQRFIVKGEVLNHQVNS